ncbi:MULTISPECIES: LacI family DNA-binding transcriptional regulator [Pseudomonas]|uniref:LacI family DNA-binding transcriptional regulator n=1 Tax=Pseudomonas TaxID=286 RepID=UPI000CFC8EE2|nr:MULTISPECIES: LacI family DNA-binding transcriptional regulator [Pseudomonas]PQZ87243.1 transcriptional regulator [Pseudomonas trivialis]PRB24273.1 transcriptional regulator [Pseudomonas sp. MYb60]
MPRQTPAAGWKGPTVEQIAKVARVGPATVDRVLNNRSGVGESTRLKVLAALDKLRQDLANGMATLHITLFCDSGETFNATLADAQAAINASTPGVVIHGEYRSSHQVDPAAFADQVQAEGASADGVIVVSREHPAINRAIRSLCRQGIAVVCLTTDLPNSGRSAYVGNDQYAAGSVAGLLVGNALARQKAKILLVTSEPFRCQQEREMGFRRVLRAEFPHLKIDERMLSDDSPQTIATQLTRYFARHACPAAIYNVAGANRGVAQALGTLAEGQRPVFVGHELTVHTRALLEAGVMDYVVSHDFVGEVAAAVRWIRGALDGARAAPPFTRVLVHTRYNCD